MIYSTENEKQVHNLKPSIITRNNTFPQLFIPTFWYHLISRHVMSTQARDYDLWSLASSHVMSFHVTIWHVRSHDTLHVKCCNLKHLYRHVVQCGVALHSIVWCGVTIYVFFKSILFLSCQVDLIEQVVTGVNHLTQMEELLANSHHLDSFISKIVQSTQNVKNERTDWFCLRTSASARQV